MKEKKRRFSYEFSWLLLGVSFLLPIFARSILKSFTPDTYLEHGPGAAHAGLRYGAVIALILIWTLTKVDSCFAINLKKNQALNQLSQKKWMILLWNFQAHEFFLGDMTVFHFWSNFEHIQQAFRKCSNPWHIPWRATSDHMDCNHIAHFSRMTPKPNLNKIFVKFDGCPPFRTPLNWTIPWSAILAKKWTTLNQFKFWSKSVLNPLRLQLRAFGGGAPGSWAMKVKIVIVRSIGLFLLWMVPETSGSISSRSSSGTSLSHIASGKYLRSLTHRPIGRAGTVNPGYSFYTISLQS